MSATIDCRESPEVDQDRVDPSGVTITACGLRGVRLRAREMLEEKLDVGVHGGVATCLC